jgi:hypothetical protein
MTEPNECEDEEEEKDEWRYGALKTPTHFESR